MHTHPFHRFALALLVFFGLAGVAVAAAAAWGFDLTAWTALAALVLSALLVTGARIVHEAWQAARWNAGERLR